MIRLAAVATLLACLFASATFGDDWERWLGPEGVGISRETGLLKEWPSGGP